jgi:hypothetical protein
MEQVPEMLEQAEPEEEKPAPAPRRRLRRVSVIAHNNKSTLVQWAVDGDVRRAYVPTNKVEKDKVDETVLKQGIPYGVPWEDVVEVRLVTSEDVGRAMRRANLWTVADLERNPQKAKKVLCQLSGIKLGTLRRAAKRLEEV